MSMLRPGLKNTATPRLTLSPWAKNPSPPHSFNQIFPLTSSECVSCNKIISAFCFLSHVKKNSPLRYSPVDASQSPHIQSDNFNIHCLITPSQLPMSNGRGTPHISHHKLQSDHVSLMEQISADSYIACPAYPPPMAKTRTR